MVHDRIVFQGLFFNMCTCCSFVDSIVFCTSKHPQSGLCVTSILPESVCVVTFVPTTILSFVATLYKKTSCQPISSQFTVVVVIFLSFLNSPTQYNMKTTAILAIALALTVHGATCGLEVAQIFTDATTSPEALTCVKDSGISLAPNTKYTDADLAKVLAAPSCTTQAVNPPCDFPNPKGDGTTLNTATFKWTFKDLFSLGAANSTNSSATDGGSYDNNCCSNDDSKVI
ncbi:hypothetical protein AC1031_020504, partial [Aphanomyces cochlioides]